MTDERNPDRTPDVETPDAGGGAILIVDDRPDKLVALKAALGSVDHEIILAGSGPEALRWLLRRDFAVVLLDVNMPVMDGFETARLIRQRRRNQHTPLIFITSYGDDVHAIEGYSLGAVDFLSAPVVPAVLRSKVEVFLELHRRNLQVREHADRLMQQTRRLQALNRASLEIHAALSIAQTLQVVADSAREILGARQACVIVTADQHGMAQHELVISPVGRVSTRAGARSGFDLPGVVAQFAGRPHPAADELASANLGPFWTGDFAATSRGLAAPLIGRGGNTIGVLLASGRREGEYTADEEALFVQLAQMAASSVENTLFAEAREANRVKDEFLATLSHELRTPLSSILGWAQLLKTKMLDEDETREALEIIERNGQMQCKLIEDLLDVSRIVTGKMQLNLRPISLVALTEAAVNVMLPSAQARQVQIETTLDPRVDRFVGDPDRLQQVLWNLLTNAVKFSAPGGRVEVSLELDDSQVVIKVCDHGEGIAAEFLPHVFDRFRQADSSASRKHGGLGIGLAIVRHVVELHGGSVRAESEGAGRGTTIAITLPLPADMLRKAPEDPGEEPIVTNIGRPSDGVPLIGVQDEVVG
ncbi:MAG TPA: ATP-binding protein [Planctomycetaceae bacterium]